MDRSQLSFDKTYNYENAKLNIYSNIFYGAPFHNAPHNAAHTV